MKKDKKLHKQITERKHDVGLLHQKYDALLQQRLNLNRMLDTSDNTSMYVHALDALEFQLQEVQHDIESAHASMELLKATANADKTAKRGTVGIIGSSVDTDPVAPPDIQNETREAWKQVMWDIAKGKQS